MLLEADVAFRGAVQPIQTTGADVHAVQAGTLGMALSVGSIEHGASTLLAETPQYALRGSIPGNMVFPLFDFKLPHRYGRPGNECRSMRSSAALTVAMSEKTGWEGDTKFDVSTETATGGMLIFQFDLLRTRRPLAAVHDVPQS